MGALTSNHNKRDASYQSSPSEFDYNHLHIDKKPKFSPYIAPTKPSRRSSVSRLSLYPQKLTPILRELHAPCRFISGFTAKLTRLRRSVTNALFSKYNHSREIATGRGKHVKIEERKNLVEVIDCDKETDDADSGSSSIDVIEIVEDEREEIDMSVETQQIVAKYRELDQKGPSTSYQEVSELRNGKMLESLSMNQGSDAMDVDARLPLHRKLYESAGKHDPSLRRLKFEIKLQETKRALLQQSRPAKKKEDVANDPFKPLTEEEEEMVANALSYVNRNKVLVTHENSNITITGQVMQCLRPRAWLNDEVINVYLELLKERENKEPKKFLKCHFFNTFFYKKLISGKGGYDYKSVRRWTTQKKLGYSLLECDKIFVPIHKEIHWCLAVINKKEEKFQYLDSLRGADKKVLRMLAMYITDEVKDKTGKNIDVTSWEHEYVTDLPNQENGYDCGMFMIKYADFYSRDIGLCFNQEHMPYFRSRTAKEILKLRAN
ncbi:hypothetical protein SSX86_006159 [Deinandra increscens subsp. villosa]|uniref:Ubiquitin-like protease family profile domain-containing protein n=1 Tax=Deinandra increscens subsp. villosa TaxID=3103831 RepID=A0AAP0HAI1_9ASTR